MSNTSIQLKKSGISGNTPSDLGYGELALNYADGVLYYKDYTGFINNIKNQDSFATIIGNGTPVIATSSSDILSIEPSNGITIDTDGIVKSITIGVNENELTTFVKKTGDTMTGDLHVDSANIYSNYSIVNTTLYCGLATRSHTPLPNVIAQFTSNSATYTQVNQQNIDQLGSADYVITADVGTDTDYYIDMGLLGSQFVPHTFNSLGSASVPLDGYLVVKGSSIGQSGGNLILGTVTTETPGLKTKIVSGGSNTENIVVEFGENGTHAYGNVVVDGVLSGPTISNVITLAQAAFDQANVSSDAALAYNQANAAFDQANVAYEKANTILDTGGNLYANSVTSNSFFALPGSIRSGNQLRISETTGLIDVFDTRLYGSAKYQIQVGCYLGYETFDLSVIADGISTKFQVFNNFNTSQSLGTITTDYDGTFSYIYYSPVSTPTNIIYVRDTFAPLAVGLPFPGDLTLGTSTIDLFDGGATFDLESSY